MPEVINRLLKDPAERFSLEKKPKHGEGWFIEIKLTIERKILILK